MDGGSQSLKPTGDRIVDMAIHFNNIEMAHAVLDLARTARREIRMSDLSETYLSKPYTSYEAILLYKAMPEMARRLNSESQAPFVMTSIETGLVNLKEVSDQRLREIVGLSWHYGDFERIAQTSRSMMGPGLTDPEKSFAVEVIARDPVDGNIVEMALARISLPHTPIPERDVFARSIAGAMTEAGLDNRSPVWGADLSDELKKTVENTEDILTP